MNSDNMKMQAAIGLFILTAIVITMLMVIFMTGGVRLGNDAYLVVINIDNIGELKTGAPAKFGGVQIGKVKSITIENEGVHIVAGINRQYRLQADTTARIATSGLVGDAFLEFTRGKSHEPLKQSQDLADAARVPGVSQSGMGEMMVKIQSIGNQVEELVGNINQLIGKKEFRENIEQSVVNVNSITAEMKSLLVDFHDNLDQVDKAVENIVKITGDAETTMKTVDGFVTKMVGDTQLAEDIVSAVKNVNAITGTLAANKESIAVTLQNIGQATGNIASITGNIQPGRGILRLLSDEQAGAEIMSVISSLQRAARCIATVGLSDLIADKLVGDKIAEKWMSEHGKGSAENMAREWKTWMTRQKAYADSLSRSGAYSVSYAAPTELSVTPAGTVRYCAVPEPAPSAAGAVDPAYEIYYDAPAGVGENAPAAASVAAPAAQVQVTPAAPAPGRHPLEMLYRGK